MGRGVRTLFWSQRATNIPHLQQWGPFCLLSPLQNLLTATVQIMQLERLYAQTLLRDSSHQRSFVIVGVTNFIKLRWFKIYRGSHDGSAVGVQDDEEGLCIRHSLAGFMQCPLDQLGICERSVSSRAGRFPLGPFLGEGLTSNVYTVCINNE